VTRHFDDLAIRRDEHDLNHIELFYLRAAFARKMEMGASSRLAERRMMMVLVWLWASCHGIKELVRLTTLVVHKQVRTLSRKE